MGRKIHYFVLIIFISVAIAAFATKLAAQNEGNLIPELKLFAKALGAIYEAYPENLQPRVLLYRAVGGMLASLDRFSEFIEPERFKLFRMAVSGEYAGIGAMLQLEEGKIFVQAVQPGKPAEKAGLRPKDIILKINGLTLEGKSIGDVSAMLRGEEDTPVVLTILREPDKVFDLEILRRKIEIQAVQEARIIGRSLAYFRLVAWQENTVEQADQVLSDLKQKGMEALIIDLRDNDGGLLKQAVALASRFLKKGEKIVSVQSKVREQQRDYMAEGETPYEELPLVILVNEKSASASEVFSSAMQDHGRATIVGTQTFGKGSVQSVIPLDEVSGMKLTTARYITPSGKFIDSVGLTPDQVVINEREGEQQTHDYQILEAIAILKKYM